MAEEEKKSTPIVTAVGDYTRHVQFLYLVGIAIAVWLFNKLISATWMIVGEPKSAVVISLSLTLSIILAMVLWRHKRIRGLAYEAVTELTKVTWPTKKELYAAIVAVILVSIIVSIILFLFDIFWNWATTKIYAF